MGDTSADIIITVVDSLTSLHARRVFDKAECFDRSQNTQYSPSIVF